MRVFCVCMVSWTLYGPPSSSSSHGLYPRGLHFLHKGWLSLSEEGLSPEDLLIYFRILSTDVVSFRYKPWLVLVHYLSHPWKSFSSLGWVLPLLPTAPFPRHTMAPPPPAFRPTTPLCATGSPCLHLPAFQSPFTTVASAILHDSWWHCRSCSELPGLSASLWKS